MFLTTGYIVRWREPQETQLSATSSVTHPLERLSAVAKPFRCRRKNTIAEVLRGVICYIDLFHVCSDVTARLCVQVRSWWTTSPSICSPSGSGRLFPMWSQVTWRVSCLTPRLQSLRTGTLSLMMWRELSCREYVFSLREFEARNSGVSGKKGGIFVYFPTGGSLAEPLHACLLPWLDFMALHARGDAV